MRDQIEDPGPFDGLPFYIVLDGAFKAIEEGNGDLALAAIDTMRASAVIWPHAQDDGSHGAVEAQFDSAMDTLERLVHRTGALYREDGP